MSKNLTIEDCKNILNYYNIQLPTNIYKIKKKANYLISKKMCYIKEKNINKKNKKVFRIIRKKSILSHNKKYVKNATMRIRVYQKYNATKSLSPIYFYCLTT